MFTSPTNAGCHINPAVTAGLFVGAKIGLIKAVLYIVLQCVGALIGAGLLHVSNDKGKPRWFGKVDKALASHSWGQGSNPAETRG